MAVELLLGDCMEYMRAQPDKSFNLAIVDPPYGLKCFRGGGKGYLVAEGSSRLFSNI
jgi:DNA modification methylase